MPGDVFLISSNSRIKLNAFRYVPSVQECSHNMSTIDQNRDDLGTMDTKVLMADGDLPAPATQSNGMICQEIQPEKILPQTPAHRIPLADLISNTEEAFNRAPGKAITPEDHVFWKHEPCNTNPRDVSGSPLATGKKRHRSASPTSSPLGVDPTHNVSSPQPSQRFLRTPQHDIAADLWSKYIGKVTGNPGGDAPKPQFSHLIASSPQTPVDVRAGKDLSTLRRSNSCNVYWPTSNTKRRRVDNAQQAVKRVQDIFAGSRNSLLGAGTSKSSKISLLVGKIQETLLKSPRKEISGPSSSTPLPERSDNIAEYSGSSLKYTNDNENNPIDTPSRSSRRVVSSDPVHTDAMDNVQDLNAMLSEFDEDGLDDDFLEFAGAAGNQLNPIHSGIGPSPDALQNETLKASSTVHRQPDPSINSPNKPYKHSMPPTSHAHTSSDDVEEFHDSDNEFSEAMEQVLARYDLREQTNANKQESRILEGSLAHDLGEVAASKNEADTSTLDRAIFTSDDEFDEDIDLGSIGIALQKTAGTNVSSQVGHPVYQ